MLPLTHNQHQRFKQQLQSSSQPTVSLPEPFFFLLFFSAIKRNLRQIQACVFVRQLMAAKVAAATFDSDSPGNGNEGEEDKQMKVLK